ncbi:MAG: NUDIX domain-containing protein [Oscillospiraceae bacterium]|nr:NUDIX domain-containing protein [Oscillospiraceae bacterium]
MESIKTRAFAGTFLRYQDEVILMKRGMHKKLGPGLWAGIGGHIEPSDADSPVTACFREIEEETGILPAQIESLNLRYFALLKSADTIDSIYYFVGELNEKAALRDTDEGTLHWIKLGDGIGYQMAPFMKSFYTHWVDNLSDNTFHCFLDSDIQLINQSFN